MNVKELSIGSLIRFDGVGVSEVNGINKDIVYFKANYHNCTYNSRAISGILITEDIIINKLGFKKTLLFFITKRYVLNGFKYKIETIKKPKYVHVLQNLYLIKTGNELIIKS